MLSIHHDSCEKTTNITLSAVSVFQLPCCVAHFTLRESTITCATLHKWIWKCPSGSRRDTFFNIWMAKRGPLVKLCFFTSLLPSSILFNPQQYLINIFVYAHRSSVEILDNHCYCGDDNKTWKALMAHFFWLHFLHCFFREMASSLHPSPCFVT